MRLASVAGVAFAVVLTTIVNLGHMNAHGWPWVLIPPGILGAKIFCVLVDSMEDPRERDKHGSYRHH